MRRYTVLSAVASVILLAGACSSSSSSSKTGSGSGGATGGKGSAVAGKNITFVSALLADANWQSVNSCFASRAKELGIKETIVAPPNETASNSGMVSLTEQALASHPDGLVVVPLVPAAFDNVLSQVKSSKIPVVSLIADTTSPDQRTALVWTDPKSYGKQGADLVGKLTNGTGNIGILYSGPAVTNQVTSIAAFKAEIAKSYPNMKIVDSGEIISPGGNRSQSAAAGIARGMLVAHPEINVIYSPDGLGGIAGALAARELNKKPGDIKIIGSDHLPQVASDLKAGWETASLQFVSCDMGKAIVDAFVQHWNGTLTSPITNVPAVVWDHSKP